MSSHARNTLTFSALTMVSRISGLLRMMAITASLGGLGRLNDSYMLAYSIPYMIYEFIMGGLLSAIFIPLLVSHQEKHGKDSPEAWRAANLLVGYAGVILAATSALAAIFAGPIVGLMTALDRHQTGQPSQDLAAFFLRYFAPQMLFFGLNAVFMAISNSRGRFAASAAAPIVNNTVAIVTLLSFRLGWVDETGLGIGTTLGVAAMALVQFIAVLRDGMPFRPRSNFRDPIFRSVAGLGLPIIALSVANLIGTTIRANLLWTVPGGFSTYSISFVLIMTPYGVLAVSLATVLYPTLSRNFAETDISKFRATFAMGLRWTTLVMMPVAAGMSVLAQPIARVLFERGDFTYNHAIFMADFLKWYSLSILPYALLVFTTRAFYAMKDTVTPTVVNITGVVLNTILNIVLMRAFGLKGIAIATGITHTCSLALSLVLLRRKTQGVSDKDMKLSVLRITTATAIMVAAVSFGLHATAREVDALERGTRFKPQLPASAASGNALLIRSQESWKQFWEFIQRSPDALPQFDFGRESVVAAFGPRSAAPTLLQLRQVEFETSNTARLRIDVDGQSTSATLAADAPTSPSFMLALIRRPLQSITPEFHITGKPVPSTLQRLLQAQDGLRLLLLILLGSFAFLATAFALRTSELRILFGVVMSRISRARTARNVQQP